MRSGGTPGYDGYNFQLSVGNDNKIITAVITVSLTKMIKNYF